ncbi:hypothetical protein WL27_11180 [Burkholderia multivorans]|uniref:hypothetical protein n=1 Tax=Burkholderia multivorans TaxID=87883 RepID=UPI00075D1EB5|nr:hypothetical protein [Burkholderia multivorans]KWA42465.1 hypothetical protein WL27_11180 [Burkholderia multivorans]
MMIESAIRYELLTSAGLRTVTGEHVVIPNDVGATFGIHAEPYLADGHPEKWVVTHLASGMQAGTGTSRTAAITNATTNVERNRPRLRAMLDEAIAARTDLQFATYQLERNRRAILGEAA